MADIRYGGLYCTTLKYGGLYCTTLKYGGLYCTTLKYGGLYCTTIFRIFAKRFANFHNQRRVVISDLRNMADYWE